MKTILKLFLLLSCVYVQAKDITVPVGSDITPYVGQAASGDNVLLLAGNYTISGNARLTQGANIKGAGIGKTIITNTTFNWWTGAIHLLDGDGKGQVVSGFTLLGNNLGFEGIKVEARNNVLIEKVAVRDFIYAGIEIQSKWEQTQSNITIQDFEIYDSSMEGGSSYGNLTLRGDLKSITIQRFYIEAIKEADKSKYAAGVKGSGYPIKSFANWANGDFSKNEWQRDITVTAGRFNSKPGVVYNKLPNFNLEVWNINVENYQITNNEFNAQVSLEYGYQKPTSRSFYVSGNKFRVRNGQSVELTASYSLVENNQFSFADNTGWLNLFGTYNGQANIRDITFRSNVVDLAGKNVLLVNSKGQYVNLVVENNVFSNGSATLVFYETGSAKGSSINFRNNVLPKSYAKATYSGLSASEASFNFTDGPVVTNPTTPTIPDKPIPLPNTPQPGKTIVTSRWREYKPAVIRDDDKGTITITIPYEVKTETKEK